MNLRFLLLPCALILTACNPVKTMDAGKKAVEDFHTDYNAGAMEKLYDEAGPAFKSTLTKEQGVSFLLGVKEKMGAVKSMEVTRWYARSMNLQTSVDVTCKTEFENGTAMEAFTYQIDNGVTKLHSYRIDSPLLLPAPSVPAPAPKKDEWQ